MIALALSVVLACPPGAGASLQPIELMVAGGEDNWHAHQMFALSWSNPPGVAAVHYRLLDPEERVLSGTAKTLPRAATEIEHLSVPAAPGAYTAEVWLEDAKGAQGPAAGAKLRFDDAHPGDVAPLPAPAWVGRSAFPYTVRLTHPSGPLPISGVRGYAISTDSSPTGNPCAAAICSEAETDLQGGIAADSLAIAELPEGVNYVHAVAVSGSGTPSALAGTTVLRVDKTEPLTRIEGVPAGWSAEPVRLTAEASDDGSGMAMTGGGGPFTAIQIDGGTPTIGAGASVSATVIASGVHTVAYYARDAVGNVADGATGNGRTNHPPATTTVKIDREPPRLAFAAAPNAGDPELIEARAEDRLSGLDPGRGSIAVRRLGAGDRFVALPTQVSAGTLRARWNSSAYPAGEYEFRVAAFDLAGNETTSLERADGTAMRLSGPLKVPVRLLIRGGRKRTVRYGRGSWFAGWALTARRTPLAGATVRVSERFAGGGPADRVSTVRTGEDGRFGIRLASGPSREVLATVAPSATTRGASSEPLALTVHSRVVLRVSARVAKIGGPPLVFRGKVASQGAPMPEDGKVVQLQFRLPGLPWSEFRSVRTGADGRFRYAYRFSDDDSRGARFQFRAYAPAQAGWPYEPAGSLPVTVVGV